MADQFHQTISRLDASAVRDLQRLWPGVNFDAYPSLLIGRIIGRYRAEAINAASTYLAADKPSGEPVIVEAEPLEAEALSTSVRVTGPVAYRRALGNGMSEVNAAKSALVQTSGMATRHVNNGARQTVMRSAIEDPDAVGWRRVAVGKTCSFCLMLIGRGAVYTESTADFKAHDHCNCAAEVSWKADGHNLSAAQKAQADAAQRQIVSRRERRR